MNILVKYDGNWVDEFDVYGFMVTTDTQWEKHLADAKKHFKNRDDEVECYFGTNEAITYSDYEDYARHFSTHPLTADDLAMLQKLFGGYNSRVGYGHFLTIDADDSDEDYED